MIDVSYDAAPEALAGLAGQEGLDEIEALMIHLAVGGRLDRLGLMVQEHLASGGRRMRARLALAAAEALGLSRAAAIGWGAACELVHNATLVHDDLQDGDEMRRGRASLWAHHGAAQAINAGDLLLMLPFLALAHLDTDDATRWRLSRAIAARAERTVRGQATEMELVGNERFDWHSWVSAAEGKSGALLSLPVEGAAILAGLREASVRPLAEAFGQLGVLYQVHDDVRDLWGDKGRDRRGNDLREGKASALVVAHLGLHPDDTDELVDVLSKPREETTDAEVDGLVRRFETGGALALVRERIIALEGRVLDNPTLAAVPDLHAIAAEIVGQLRRDAPAVIR